MKRILSMFMVIAMLLTLTPTHSAIAAVKINKSKATMEVGSTLKLKVSGTKSKVKWATSKSSIATVNSAGTITAKKEGQTTVSGIINKKPYSCIVTVVNSSKKEVTAPKGTITELSSGTYVIGEDFPAGKYNVKTVSGSGNFLASGNETYVNEIFAMPEDEFFDTATYNNMRLWYGDKMTISGGVVLEFSKLD